MKLGIHLRRLKTKNKTTAISKITMLPGHKKKPRPLLYPPTATQPDDNSKLETIIPQIIGRDASASRLARPQSILRDIFELVIEVRYFFVAALFLALLDPLPAESVPLAPLASAAPSTAPFAAPEAAPLRTLPTASFTLVKIPFAERDLPDFPDFFAVFVFALVAFFVPDLEADFFAPLVGVFFLLVFFVAILILS